MVKTMPTAKRIPGLDIAVYESPAPGPAIFCLHGNSQSGQAYAAQLEGEPGYRFHLVTMDLPGHCNSFRASDAIAAYAIPKLAETIQRVAERLDLGPTLYVGHSLGGHLLIQSASGLPNLAGLMIFGTPPLPDPAYMQQGFLPHPSTPGIFKEELSDAEVDAFARGQLYKKNSEIANYLRRTFKATDPRFRSSLGASVARGELKDECAAIRRLAAPVAILHGTKEEMINGAYIDNLPLGDLWRGGVQRIADVGHCPHMEDPGAFNRLLMAFSRTVHSDT